MVVLDRLSEFFLVYWLFYYFVILGIFIDIGFDIYVDFVSGWSVNDVYVGD